MRSDEDKQRADLREAFRRGLEQGYNLAKKRLERPAAEDGSRPAGPEESRDVELPLYVQQLIEIALEHGVNFQ